MSGIKPKCDFCNQPAKYDTQTKLGPWAFVCDAHLATYTTGLYKALQPKPIVSKVCGICGKKKSIEDFYKYTDANGVERWRNECKECNLAARKHNAYMKSKKNGDEFK